MAALAKAAGQQEVASLLNETLQEEKQTDEKLTQLAESEINPAAFQGAEAEEGEQQQQRGGGGRRSSSAA